MNSVPPFVANTEDGMHCVNAVFRMVAQHLLGRDYTWEEIDALSHASPPKATWTFPVETAFAKMGLHVRNIEPIDYDRLHKEGLPYLKGLVGPDTYDYFANKSNVESVLHLIPEFIATVEHETRRAEMQEILKWLQEGKLVAAELNSRILNNREGLSLHFVLLYDYDGENILLHDPGLPPLESRKVSVADFEKAFSYPGANGETTLFWK